MQADEHESSTIDEIKEKEPEFFWRVTAILKRAEMEFFLWEDAFLVRNRKGFVAFIPNIILISSTWEISSALSLRLA